MKRKQVENVARMLFDAIHGYESVPYLLIMKRAVATHRDPYKELARERAISRQSAHSLAKRLAAVGLWSDESGVTELGKKHLEAFASRMENVIEYATTDSDSVRQRFATYRQVRVALRDILSNRPLSVHLAVKLEDQGLCRRIREEGKTYVEITPAGLELYRRSVRNLPGRGNRRTLVVNESSPSRSA